MCERFCTACGVLLEAESEQITELEETIKNQAVQPSRKQGEISRLKGERAEAHPPEYADALEIAMYWREKVAPLARELEGERLRLTIDRLRGGYSKEELRRAVFGYSCRPHREYGKRLRMTEGGKWDADLETIMKSAKTVDVGICIANEEMRHDQGILNGGGRRHFAELCDCGHPRVEHGLFRVSGHEACYDADCSCQAFDDLTQRSEQWLAVNNYEVSHAKVRNAMSPFQESLL